MKLRKQLVRRAVREADIGAAESFVKNRSAERTPHLLLFDGVTGSGKHVTSAGKNCPRDAPIQRGKESKDALFERNQRITAAKLNAICWDQMIDRGRIDSQ